MKKKNITTINFDSVAEFREALRMLKFMPSKYNRAVVTSHVKRMRLSVTLKGVLRQVIVVKTDLFGDGLHAYVIDGQHLVEAILGMKEKDIFGAMTITYVEVDSKEDVIHLVSLLNSTAKNWKLPEYLNAWCSAGFKDYLFIQQVMAKTGLGLSGLVQAYSGKSRAHNIEFKEGRFKAIKEIGDKVISVYRAAVKLGLRENNSAFLAVAEWAISDRFEEGKFFHGIRTNATFGEKHRRDPLLGLFTAYCM